MMRSITKLCSLAWVLIGVVVSSVQAEKYRIAVIIPLSGQVASLGRYVRNGIELARSELSAKEQDAIEVVYEDDQFQAVQTVSAYRRLKATGPVHAVVVLGSPTAQALVPLTERDGVVLIAVGASDPTIVVGKKYAFIHWVIPAALADPLAREIKKRDYKHIALISAETAGAVADLDAAKAALIRDGLGERIVHRETFPPDQTDYRTVIARFREKQVDSVVMVLFPGALAPFAKQAKAAKLAADLIGMETFEDEAEVKNAEGGLLGAWFASASDPTDEFVRSYKARFNEHPGWATGNAYDTLRLLAASAALHGVNNDAMRSYLSSLKDYRGAAGKYSASGDNRFFLPAGLRVITVAGFERFGE